MVLLAWAYWQRGTETAGPTRGADETSHVGREVTTTHCVAGRGSTRYVGRWGTYGLADELWAAAGGGQGSVRLRNGRYGGETPWVRPTGGATASTSSTSMGA
eukprot:COSAG06_NODE_6623_length_2852_cov_4.446785_5_plen_102_part_00